MSLIALPPDYLRLSRRLPFGVYDANRNLLVAPGRSIEDPAKLDVLRSRPLFVDEQEAGPYATSFQRSAHELVHKNATLEMIASAQVKGGAPAPSNAPSRTLTRSQLAGAGSQGAGSQRAAPLRREGPLSERVDHLIGAHSLALRDAGEAQWRERIDAVTEALQDLVKLHPDSLLYLLMQHTAHKAVHYTAAHGLLCAVIAERAAALLEWSEAQRQALVGAALTMDASIAVMQDSLVEFDSTPRPNQAAQLKTHAERSAELLTAAGVDDALWLELVKRHHEPLKDLTTFDTLAANDRCAALLATVEAYTARLTRRGDRPPPAPMVAVRETCVSAHGQLNPAGAAIVRAIGMYPPGSYVRLQGGELGVVFATGRRMNTPMVAVFLGTSGLALKDPLVRDSGQPGRNILEPVAPEQIKVQVQHERVLALR